MKVKIWDSQQRTRTERTTHTSCISCHCHYYYRAISGEIGMKQGTTYRALMYSSRRNKEGASARIAKKEEQLQLKNQRKSFYVKY